MNNKAKLFTLLKVIVSLSLLGLLFWLTRKNLQQIYQLLSSINFFFFTLGVLAFMAGLVLMAYRLQLILAVHGTNLSLKELVNLTLIGYFFSNFMPSSLGGDVVKAHYIAQKNNQRLAAYASTFIDRVIGLFSVTLIACVTLSLIGGQIENKLITWSILLLLFSCLGFILLIFQKNLLKKLGRATKITRLLKHFKIDSAAKKAYQALAVYATGRQMLIRLSLISVAAQGLSFLSIYFLAQGLLLNLGFAKVLLVMPIIFALCTLPISINGLGVREWGFVFFFSQDIGEAAALSLSLLYLAMSLLSSLLGGIIYLFRR